ncbi:MAG: hypothetical protein ACR2QM_21070 [Longimicrobiales bacterium]
MTSDLTEVASAAELSTPQRLFLRYFTAILLDLVVLGLFAQYWDRVHVDSFSITLLAAVLLQVLLKLTLALEHRVASFFTEKQGGGAKVMRVLSAWAILFGSKFVILYALQFAFGDAVHFEGAMHGVVALILVLVVMLAAEEAIVRFYRALG